MTAYSSSSEHNALIIYVNYISDKHSERVKLVSLLYTNGDGYFRPLILERFLIQPLIGVFLSRFN